MNTLHVFGDSFTEGQPSYLTFPPFLKWKELRGGTLPPCWSELLSEKLGMELMNYAIGGNSNAQIFDDVCTYSHNFKKGDIVIVNWTYIHRFRWGHLPYEDDGHGDARYKDENGNPMDWWRKFSINNDNPHDFEYIDRSTKDAINHNLLTYSVHVKKIYNRERLLEEYSKSKGFDLFFWSADDYIINRLPDEQRLVRKYILHDIIIQDGYKENRNPNGGDFLSMIINNGGQTIMTEISNLGRVDDNTHLGESGHRVQCELFYDYILRKDTFKDTPPSNIPKYPLR
jgi:hypothetical protein